MLLEGLKLMGLGMTSVMLFLMFMILCIECIRYLNRNFTAREKASNAERQNSEHQNTISKPKKAIPIEVFAAAISAFESDKNS